MNEEITHEERFQKLENILQRILEEKEEECNVRSEEATQKKIDANVIRVPSWVWSLMVSLGVVITGCIWVTGQFNGKFEEFRVNVLGRLDRIEQRQYEERTRSPEGYISPPVGTHQ